MRNGCVTARTISPTREGVVIPEKDADTPPTEKQKAYIQRLTKNLPLCCGLLEYEDYKEHPTRMTAAEFIAQAYEQFVAPMDKRENYIDYVANRPGAQQARWARPVGRQRSGEISA